MRLDVKLTLPATSVVASWVGVTARYVVMFYVYGLRWVQHVYGMVWCIANTADY